MMAGDCATEYPLGTFDSQGLTTFESRLGRRVKAVALHDMPVKPSDFLKPRP